MKKVVSIFLLTVTLLNLTACTSNFKVNEDIVKDLSDKITENVINTVDKEKVEKKENYKLDASKSDELIINGSVGEIKISSHDSDEALIDVSIASKSKDKEKAKKLIDDYTYSVKAESDAIKINTTISNDKVIGEDSIEVNLDIKIPAAVKQITVVSNVGDIQISNIIGDLKISNNVGEIRFENAGGSCNVTSDVGEIILNKSILTGESEFKTNTGEISISASEISEAKKIFAEANVGDIKIELPESSDYKAEIHEFMEKERTEIHGNGKTKIKLTTHVGNIDFK